VELVDCGDERKAIAGDMVEWMGETAVEVGVLRSRGVATGGMPSSVATSN